MGAHRRIGSGMQGTNAHCCARAVCWQGEPQYSPSTSRSQLLVDGEGGRVLAIAPRLPSLISRGGDAGRREVRRGCRGASGYISASSA